MTKTLKQAGGRLVTPVAPETNGNGKTQTVSITPPKFSVAEFTLRGAAPYVSAKFSAKARNQIQETQEAGSTARGKKNRKARDFEADYLGSIHRSVEGWEGMPASAFRTAMISACRLVQFKMTMAKMSVFIEADGYDETDGIPLVRISGKHEKNISPVRNATGVCDLRARAMWRDWSAKLRVRYDTDQFTLQDVTNLLSRVGMQVGIGEGRPDSRESCGMGWGLFTVEGA